MNVGCYTCRIRKVRRMNIGIVHLPCNCALPIQPALFWSLFPSIILIPILIYSDSDRCDAKIGPSLPLAVDLAPNAPIAPDWASSVDGPFLSRVRRSHRRQKDEGRRDLSIVNVDVVFLALALALG